MRDLRSRVTPVEIGDTIDLIAVGQDHPWTTITAEVLKPYTNGSMHVIGRCHHNHFLYETFRSYLTRIDDRWQTRKWVPMIEPDPLAEAASKTLTHDLRGTE